MVADKPEHATSIGVRLLASLVDEEDKTNPNWREESGVSRMVDSSFLFGTVSLG